MPISQIRVAVCVVTYNQESYIEQCIRSVLTQKANFRIDIIVGNDCSTDGTAQVLRTLQQRYDQLVVFNRTHNMGLVENTIQCFEYIFAHDYKYVAMLDGDDYWCDNLKLQRQVNLMEQYPTMSFCYMRATSDERIACRSKEQNPDIRVEDMFAKIRSTGIPNGTVMHRTDFLKCVPYKKLIQADLLSMDYPTNVYMARQGKVGYIDSIALYWRRTGCTVSSSQDKAHALRYIDHEVRQGLFLADEFPHTAYDFSYQEAEAFRQWQIYQWALSHKDYSTIVQSVNSPDFPKLWLNKCPERNYLNSKIKFLLYVYIIKKTKTLLRILIG